MPSFDVVSEIDMQEVRNAVDQASREIGQRFDFKGTNSSIELKDKENQILMESASDDRLTALRQVLEEKLVKRSISLKSIDFGDVEEASGARARQRADLKAGVSSDDAKKINSTIKDMKLKGVQSQTQGDQVRVTAKKRDVLQEIIAALKEADLDLPLQFTNFRD
ncbi:MAG: YajQ family cyclic di-GMP-binding protein [Acidimicrobiales bacterium]|nr:YajQ family cyclic di-GMP-binding protein [Acidimicrobiales bacterium]